MAVVAVVQDRAEARRCVAHGEVMTANLEARSVTMHRSFASILALACCRRRSSGKSRCRAARWRFGKSGTNGQAQTKAVASEEAAIAERDELARDKTKTGYREVNG